MAIQTLAIVNCPYCQNENGDILLNLANLPAYFDRSERNLELHNEPAQTLLVFNNVSPDLTPCPHLVGILGVCAIGVWKPRQLNQEDKIQQRLNYCWWHSQMVGRRSDFDFSQLLGWSLRGDLWSNIPVCEQEFERTCSFGGGRDAKAWSIKGGEYFSEDIPGLLERGPALMEAKQQCQPPVIVINFPSHQKTSRSPGSPADLPCDGRELNNTAPNQTDSGGGDGSPKDFDSLAKALYEAARRSRVRRRPRRPRKTGQNHRTNIERGDAQE